eukprot:scaffold23224_cov31-Tisochrysis_lutea.AAC.5
MGGLANKGLRPRERLSPAQEAGSPPPRLDRPESRGARSLPALTARGEATSPCGGCAGACGNGAIGPPRSISAKRAACSSASARCRSSMRDSCLGDSPSGT